MRVARALVALVVPALLISGCGGKAKAVATPKRVKHLPADIVPATVLDLSVHAENDKLSKDVTRAQRSYVDAVGLYSFRKGDLLQATLQVSHFAKAANDNRQFRDTIIGQIAQSGREAQAFRVSGHTVYIAPGTQQSVALWFRGHTMYLLTARREYEQPRALMRELLKVAS